MQKIKSSEIGKIIKNNILYVIIAGLVLGLVGFFYTRQKSKDSFTAEAAILIAENKGEDLTYNTLMLNEKLATVYGEILNSEDLYQDVVDKLKLDKKAENLKSATETEVNGQAGIINFELTEKGEKETGKILDSIINEFRLKVNDHLGKDNIEYVQSVKVKDTGFSKALKAGILLGILGFLLGFLFVVGKEFFSQTIKDPGYFDDSQVELLGVIDEQ